MDPLEVIVEMFDGEPMEYPFDKHEAELSFHFESAGAALPRRRPIRFQWQLNCMDRSVA